MKIKVNCKQCGNAFDVRPVDIRRGNGKFCSQKCSGIWKSINVRGKNHPAWKSSTLICPICNKEFTRKRRDIIKGEHFACSVKCSAEMKKEYYKGDKNPKWRGGIINRPDGRRCVYAPDNPNAVLYGGSYILEYRLIAEQKIGRHLSEAEIVHHVNGDVTDNRPENLEVLNSRKEHNQRHPRERNKLGQFLPC